MAKNWYKLDNAAKIFPAIFSKDDMQTFCLSCLFKENISLEPLKKALKESLERFPTFCVKLKKGFFWYYFEHNFNEPRIIVDDNQLFNSVEIYKNNGFMFTLSYHGRRLTLEVFHALSDGSGALEFFKCICYYYLVESGIEIKNNGEIMSQDVEQNLAEYDDSFIVNYDKNINKHETEEKAFRLKGKSYGGNWVGLINVITKLDNLKDVSHKYNATITQFLGGVLLQGLYNLYFNNKKQKRSAYLFFPVNARKFFDSNTLRNFALYIRTTANLNDYDELDLKTSIDICKETFEKELTKERLASRIAVNVSYEENWLIRIVPLFLKDIIMKFAYKHFGTNGNTLSFSNLGKVEIPEEMKQYVERFEFAICPTKTTPINLGGISFDNTFVLTFATRIVDRLFIKEVVRILSNEGIEIILETNDLEVYE